MYLNKKSLILLILALLFGFLITFAGTANIIPAGIVIYLDSMIAFMILLSFITWFGGSLSLGLITLVFLSFTSTIALVSGIDISQILPLYITALFPLSIVVVMFQLTGEEDRKELLSFIFSAIGVSVIIIPIIFSEGLILYESAPYQLKIGNLVLLELAEPLQLYYLMVIFMVIGLIILFFSMRWKWTFKNIWRFLCMSVFFISGWAALVVISYLFQGKTLAPWTDILFSNPIPIILLTGMLFIGQLYQPYKVMTSKRKIMQSILTYLREDPIRLLWAIATTFLGAVGLTLFIVLINRLTPPDILQIVQGKFGPAIELIMNALQGGLPSESEVSYLKWGVPFMYFLGPTVVFTIPVMFIRKAETLNFLQQLFLLIISLPIFAIFIVMLRLSYPNAADWFSIIGTVSWNMIAITGALTDLNMTIRFGKDKEMIKARARVTLMRMMNSAWLLFIPIAIWMLSSVNFDTLVANMVAGNSLYPLTTMGLNTVEAIVSIILLLILILLHIMGNSLMPKGYKRKGFKLCIFRQCTYRAAADDKWDNNFLAYDPIKSLVYILTMFVSIWFFVSTSTAFGRFFFGSIVSYILVVLLSCHILFRYPDID